MDPGSSDFLAARILLDEFSPSKELHQRRHLASGTESGNDFRIGLSRVSAIVDQFLGKSPFRLRSP